jgi:hypothetical protein
MIGIGQILITGPKMLLTLAIEGNELIALGGTRGFSPGNLAARDFPFMGNMTITMFDITDPRRPVMQGNIIVDSMRPGNVGGPNSLGTVSIGGGFFVVTCAAPDLRCASCDIRISQGRLRPHRSSSRIAACNRTSNRRLPWPGPEKLLTAEA